MKNLICLGIEGTAEKTGVGIVDSEGNILASQGSQLIPEAGGIHPREAAEHHANSIPSLILKALEEAGLKMSDINLISFSKGPGLGPALRTTATAARALSLTLNIPILGVNHCIGHVEIGRLTTQCEDPVTLYVSGGNSQVIAYKSGRYRVFGETLDIAIGNMLDQFARQVNLGHPGGPKIEKLALKTDNYLKLPYTVKGMDLAFSGLLTAALRKLESGNTLEDVCFSLQETAFAMLVEITERALAQAQKDEVLLVGGVGVNQRLRKMLSSMCQEHYSDFYLPPIKYCGDNGAMIAWMGQLMYKNQGREQIENTKVLQRYRTDMVDVPWMKGKGKTLKLPANLYAKGAEANLYPINYLEMEAILKERIPKSYRISELDQSLRQTRTKKEAKLIREAKLSGVKTPIILDVNKKSAALTMKKVEGILLKDLIESTDNKTIKKVGRIIGENLALLHNGGIIHGDLTTSNMIWSEEKVVFLDFGLGKKSNLIEDKGADLLVFKKSLTGIHHNEAETCFEAIINGYLKANDFNEIIQKVSEIENRGRYTIEEDI
jgi:N6-L-threonylcarbamoyladenine synthase/protein kinase Bud32